MMTRSARTALCVAASLLLLADLAHDAEAARGGRGGGGRGGGAGFSRSGAAASGSFSAPRPPQTASRQAGATQRSGQRAETRQARTEAGSSARTSGQQERTERTEARQQGQTERSEIRQQGQTERTEARSAAAAEVADDWDGHHHYYDDDDDEWGYALAGAAVGATVGYVAGAATAPTYVTVLPCTPNVVVVGSMNYYGCGDAWYNRTYVGGSVTYVTVAPPSGLLDRIAVHLEPQSAPNLSVLDRTAPPFRLVQDRMPTMTEPQSVSTIWPMA